MRVVRGCEEFNVEACVALKRLVTDVRPVDGTVVTVGSDVPCDLSAGETGNLHDVALHDLFFRSLERKVFEPDKGAANPSRPLLAQERTEGERKNSFDELLEIADGLKKRIVEHGDHMEEDWASSGRSVSSSVRKGLGVQSRFR